MHGRQPSKVKSSTLKLLSDVELSKEVGEDGLPVSEGRFHPGLNKTLKGAIWNQLLEVSGTANITIKTADLVNTTDWARSDISDRVGRSEKFPADNRCS